MIKKREVGQVFLLVLVLLAIGSTMAIQALRLTDTSLKSTQIATRQTQLLYAADTAQEYILWKLMHDDFGNEFTTETPVGYLTCDTCPISVNLTIVMRAVPGKGGITLATEDVIQPTKTVSASSPVSPDTPDTIANNTFQTVTYTIKLEQLSSNTTQGLDAVYDILPDVYNDTEFVENSCYMRTDGGPWLSIPDPAFENPPTRWRLKWPANYDPDTGDDPFSSDNTSANYFYGMRDFAPRQVKEIKFQLEHNFKAEDNDRVHCNWIVLKPWDTLSGPQAPLTVGSPANPGVCDDDGLIQIVKISDPEIIPPGVLTDIDYNVQITNQDGYTNHIEEIYDYLPPGFTYTGPTSGFSTDDPVETERNINGVDRWQLYWAFSPAISIAAGETLHLNFTATTTKDVSGSYYNEVQVVSDVAIPQVFQDIGITGDEYYTCYSWNSGTVTVPTYDSRADADGIIIDSNLALVVGGVSITSYQWR